MNTNTLPKKTKVSLDLTKTDSKVESKAFAVRTGLRAGPLHAQVVPL